MVDPRLSIVPVTVDDDGSDDCVVMGPSVVDRETVSEHVHSLSSLHKGSRWGGFLNLTEFHYRPRHWYTQGSLDLTIGTHKCRWEKMALRPEVMLS